jgi:Fic family protein
MDSARFIPIEAHKIGAAISAWERYFHSDALDHLVQTAVLHAEFEAIHPFLDGNGRVGRILIPLMLWRNNLLHRPLFYLSAYLDTHRDEYYDRLLAISRDHDWTSWILFFLTGLRAQAEENANKAIGIRDLYNRFKPRLIESSRSQHAILALDWIFSRPIFKSSDFVESSGIPAPTAKRLLAVMREENLGLLGTLREGSGRRPAIYIVHELFSLIEG